MGVISRSHAFIAILRFLCYDYIREKVALSLLGPRAIGVWGPTGRGGLLAFTSMALIVLVKSASNLPNVEKFSKSDPMTVCTLQGELCG